MKALVSGATGLVGSSIVRELLKEGTEVRVLVRENSNRKNIDGLEVEKAYGDIRDKDSVKTALKGCQVFYQSAALYAAWARHSSVFYDINVEGTKSVLSAALEKGVEKLVYTSSIAALGYTEDGSLANEETKFNYWNWSPYFTTKYLAEMEVIKFFEKGLPVVIVNPAVVIGVRDIKPTPSGEIILSILNRKMPGYVDAGMNFVDVEDVARGHILAAQKGRLGERYILGNTNISFKDFCDLVAEVGGIEAPQRKFSRSTAITMAYLARVVSAINHKPPFIQLAMAKAVGRNAFFDCSRAVKVLGMPQTPLRKTVEKAVKWFRDNGYVTASKA
jgi:dihydroflavonol-4-reductase